jgi:hypothetical protein
MTTSKSIVRRRDCRSDDAEAARSQFSAKLVVPFDHLGAQPRDHHRWLSIRGAENIVAKLDTVAYANSRSLVEDIGHLMGLMCGDRAFGWYVSLLCHVA